MDFKVEHEEMEHPDNVERSARLTRRVLFKTDTRTNVGNAKIIGMEKDLGLTNLQYSQGLAVFYATYIFSELPSNLVLKKVSPRIWLPTLTVVWGIITMCLGFVRNFASFAAVRAILGIAEGGLLPGMVLYLSSIYNRGELALRIGIFYTAASLSGAFGGEFLDQATHVLSDCVSRFARSWTRFYRSCRRPGRLEMDLDH
ncbi:hypothetical protein IL306_013748 [Fusarium sp. DS 682]|nr:hypothetical protein IL306_013748 [Fusarium sp. DS 682]